MNLAENNFLYMLGNFKQSYAIPTFTVKVFDGINRPVVDEHIISEYELRWIMLQIKKNTLDASTLNITCNECNTTYELRQDGCIDNDCKDNCRGGFNLNTKITFDMLVQI